MRVSEWMKKEDGWQRDDLLTTMGGLEHAFELFGECYETQKAHMFLIGLCRDNGIEEGETPADALDSIMTMIASHSEKRQLWLAYAILRLATQSINPLFVERARLKKEA